MSGEIGFHELFGGVVTGFGSVMMIRVLRDVVFGHEDLASGGQLVLVAACRFADVDDGGLTTVLARMMDCRMSEHRCCSSYSLHICIGEEGS